MVSLLMATICQKKLNTEENSKDISKMLITTLANIHKIDPKSIGLQNLGKPEGFLERQLEGWFKRFISTSRKKIK